MSRPTLKHRHAATQPLGAAPRQQSLVQKKSWFSRYGTPSYPSLVGQMFFPTDDAALDMQDYGILNQAIEAFKIPLLGSAVYLTCTGNADHRGPSGYNEDLGLTRAKAVKAYLDSKLSSFRLYSSSAKTRGELDASRSLLEADLASYRRVDLFSSYVFKRVIDMEEEVITVGEHLEFNGHRLCWFVNGVADKCWPAVSGRPGYMRREFQSLEDKGPLPEGKWILRQSEYQKMPSRNWIERVGSELGRTAWPGGASAWGRHRIWLEPAEGTNTYQRSGFSIHGGDSPGSAGCIDLTTHVPGFIVRFLQYKRDMTLIVDYSKALSEAPPSEGEQ